MLRVEGGGGEWGVKERGRHRESERERESNPTNGTLQNSFYFGPLFNTLT